MTSNAFETVEVWQLKKYDGGVERLEVQATFYDKYAFLKPVSVVYAFRHATELVKADYRVNHWECEQTSGTYLDDKGVTNFHPARRGRLPSTAAVRRCSPSCPVRRATRSTTPRCRPARRPQRGAQPTTTTKGAK